MKKMHVMIGFVAVVILFQTAVFALPISFSGGSSTGSLEGLGSFEGLLSYDAVSSKLTIQLTNTSNAANGGYLTAFALNNPDNLIGGASLTSSMGAFKLIGGTSFNNSIKARPFSNFDIGASATGDTWLADGNPSGGIGVGQTATFTFALEGNLAGLSEQSFLNELNDPNGQFFAARFRGFNKGGSDKVPGAPQIGIPPSVVPEPSTLLLLGIGFLGLFGFGRKHIMN